jgi:adenylyl-sulfate kinase
MDTNKIAKLSHRELREAHFGHRGRVFWLTGFSGAGKSTLAEGVETRLLRKGIRAAVLDGDMMRRTLCAGLGFSLEDRAENVRRIAHTAALLARLGHVCLCACIAPLAAHRHICRKIIDPDYHEIFVDCPLEVCQSRDVKGLYAKANARLVHEYTGISSPYEAPATPHLTLYTNEYSIEECLDILESFIMPRIVLSKYSAR